jgi:predicted phage terminase large subunit-like protein
MDKQPEQPPVINESWRAMPDTHARFVSNGAWRPYPYLLKISDAIVHAINKGNGLIVINLPPRHGKSEFVSYHLPLWYLDLYPDRRVILSTHTAALSRKFGRRVRNSLLGSDLTHTEVAEDSQAAEEWETKQGGGMVSVGVGGSLTGKGGHLLIVDDPIKNWEEADSEVFQNRNIDWFKTTLWTRREPGAVVVVLMTRWHKKDLAGYILSLGQGAEIAVKAQHLRFPATAEGGDLLNRQPGEPLCPERYDAEALREIRVVEGSRHYAGLYQQSPVDEGNALINKQWFRYYENRPAVCRSLITIDQAFSEKKDADYTVLTQTLTDTAGNLFVWEYQRRRVSIKGFIELLFAMVERAVGLDKVVIEIPVNENPDNSAIVMLIKAEMAERDVYFPLLPVKPLKDKIARATKFIHMCGQGKVFFRRGQVELEDELLAFPTGDHDDIVDTLSNAAIYMTKAAEDRRGKGVVSDYDPHAAAGS